MTREQAINYLKSSGMSQEQIKSVTDAFTCDDCISREEAEAIFKNARKSLYELSRKERVKDFQTREMMLLNAEQFIHLLPSVKPKFTDEEILKMQELEQAHLDKAYELGKAEMQPSEDCISRQAVIDIIDFEDKWLHDASGHNANTKIAFSGLKSRVKALPSVQPQRKRGKWKWELASNGWANHICSECEFTKNTDVHIKINWEYCPNCGAEMVGDSDDD